MTLLLKKDGLKKYNKGEFFMGVLKTSEEWQKLCRITVADPGGWDKLNFKFSWREELITKKEFEKRLMDSTVMPNKDYLSNIWKDQ